MVSLGKPYGKGIWPVPEGGSVTFSEDMSRGRNYQFLMENSKNTKPQQNPIGTPPHLKIFTSSN